MRDKMYYEKIWSSVGTFNFKIAKNEIFSNPKFIQELKNFCVDQKTDFDESKSKCLEYFNEIASRYTYNKTFWSFMEYIVRTKIIVDLKRLKYNTENLKELNELAQKNIIIFLPNHKSVFDFMILPYIIATKSYIYPSILAADTFDIFPIGPIFRKSGVYFVRRSENDPLYSFIFKYYIALLLKFGVANLFFLEGGRNKSGGYSNPKAGVIKYVLEGKKRENIDKDILFVPISLSYEFVPELEVVISEHISQKRKHISRSLVKYISLGKKFEMCYLHFNRPIKLSDFTEKYKDDKSLINNIANYVMIRIKESIIVTNTALMCYTIKKLGKETLSIQDFEKHFNTNYTFLKNNKRNVDNINLDKIEDHLKLMKSKNIIRFNENEISIPKNSKNLINYYSNNILHFFV